MRIAGIVRHSSVDGIGVRYVIFFQGCNHYCNGCHNPDTWYMNSGKEVNIQNLIDDIKNTKYIDGVTISGGEPFLQLDDLVELVKAIKEIGLNIWCYTGYTLEQLKDAEYSVKEALKYINILVDGPFILEQRDLKHRLPYTGSANQRILVLNN